MDEHDAKMDERRKLGSTRLESTSRHSAADLMGRRPAYLWAVIAWVVTRALVFVIWWTLAPFVHGDVRYYFRSLSELGRLGPQHVLVEYPTPVIILLGLPYLVSFGRWWLYVLWFILAMLALDALFARALWRFGGPARKWTVGFWIVFVALMGPTAYLRFDLVPGVLGGFALLALVRRRQEVAGAALGLGAAVKLLPALTFPSLLARTDAAQSADDLRRSRLRATAGFAGTGVLLALGSLLWAGWTRLISPLTWQSDRGLQVESIWAGLPMLLRAFGMSYDVAMSRYNAFEIIGPLRGVMLAASDASMVVGLLAIAAAYWWWLRFRSGTPYLGTVIALAVLCIMIVTNKTFSPQYIIWLGGPMAVLLVLGDEHGRPSGVARPRQTARRLAGALLVITALTQLVYPLMYDALVFGGRGLTFITIVLVVRNLLLVGLLGWLLALVFQRPPISAALGDGAHAA